MNKLVVPKQFKDLIFLDGESAETDSLRVAAKFSKRHDNVLKAIEELECSPAFREANFFESTYVDVIGRELKSYSITKDGFYILAMGFTGREAMAWKEKFIEAFNWMASALRKQYEQKALADKERYEKRMQERRINDAIEADKQAQRSYEAGVHESKCKALAIADKSAYDMIDRETRNHFFEVARLNLKIDQLTGEVMRLKAEEVNRKVRDAQQREEISRQRVEIRELRAEVRELKQGGARRRNRK